MPGTVRFAIYFLSLAVAVIALTVGTVKCSPSVVAAGIAALFSTSAVIACAVMTKKSLLPVFPLLQSVSILVSIAISEVYEIGNYWGFITGTVAYPAISGTLLALILAYTDAKTYRALIVFFLSAGTVAISNVCGICIYAMMEPQMDVTITNVANIQSFVFCLFYGIIASFVWAAYSRFVQKKRFYTADTLLEAI